MWRICWSLVGQLSIFCSDRLHSLFHQRPHPPRHYLSLQQQPPQTWKLLWERVVEDYYYFIYCCIFFSFSDIWKHFLFTFIPSYFSDLTGFDSGMLNFLGKIYDSKPKANLWVMVYCDSHRFNLSEEMRILSLILQSIACY